MRMSYLEFVGAMLRDAKFRYSLAVAFITVGTAALAFRGDIDRAILVASRPEKPVSFAIAFGIAFLFLGFALLMLRYLRGSFGEQLKAAISGPGLFAFEPDVDLYFKHLVSDVERLKAGRPGVSEEDRQAVIDALRPSINADLATEFSRRFAAAAISEARETKITETYTLAERRLRSELTALGRRSNLNLVIGVVTTMMAVSLLTYMVLGAPEEFDSITVLVAHYIPRLSLVVFIEVFSFFFLRLYRATLNEMRMYQNEITRLTVQHVAVQAAFASAGDEAAGLIAKELLSSMHGAGVPEAQTHGQWDPKALADLLTALAKAVPQPK